MARLFKGCPCCFFYFAIFGYWESEILSSTFLYLKIENFRDWKCHKLDFAESKIAPFVVFVIFDSGNMTKFYVLKYEYVGVQHVDVPISYFTLYFHRKRKKSQIIWRFSIFDISDIRFLGIGNWKIQFC